MLYGQIHVTRSQCRSVSYQEKDSEKIASIIDIILLYFAKKTFVAEKLRSSGSVVDCGFVVLSIPEDEQLGFGVVLVAVMVTHSCLPVAAAARLVLEKWNCYRRPLPWIVSIPCPVPLWYYYPFSLFAVAAADCSSWCISWGWHLAILERLTVRVERGARNVIQRQITGFDTKTLGISVHCLAVFCLCQLHRFPSGHRQKISLFVCPFHQYSSSCWWKCRRASDSWRLASSCDRDHDSNLESFHTTLVSSQKSHAVSKASTFDIDHEASSL